MIRDARTRDLPALAEAMVRVQNAHVAAFPSQYREFDEAGAKAHLVELLARADTFLRVAEQDDVVVGHFVLMLQERPETLFTHPERIALLAQIEVAPTARRVGVGIGLLEECKTIARAQEARRVVLDVGSFNEAAYAFFTAAGFSRWSSKLSMSLS